MGLIKYIGTNIQGDEPVFDVQPYQEPIEELPITEDQLIKIVAKAKELGLL